MAGEYTADVIQGGLVGFLGAHAPACDVAAGRRYLDSIGTLRRQASEALGRAVPPRPPGFCTGCPERPVFTALKLVEREVGKLHVSADIGCHALATFEPFSFGNSILGYGMSMASAAAVTRFSARRPIAIMGDGGFWHNGLLSGVSSSLLNRGDGVLIIMKNGYTSATGTQDTVSTPLSESKRVAEGSSATGAERTIENTLRGLGVQWLRTVHNYRVGRMQHALRDALTTPFAGLKIIVAEGECQLERQRRLRPIRAERLAAGRRVVRERFGVDEDTCTGDHSCIRLSGCPTLTVRDASDPLKRAPVAHVTNGCVGCGLCGEAAMAAVLCPSFHRIEIVSNPSRWDRLMDRVNRSLLGWFDTRASRRAARRVAPGAAA